MSDDSHLDSRFAVFSDIGSMTARNLERDKFSRAQIKRAGMLSSQALVPRHQENSEYEGDFVCARAHMSTAEMLSSPILAQRCSAF